MCTPVQPQAQVHLTYQDTISTASRDSEQLLGSARHQIDDREIEEKTEEGSKCALEQVLRM